METGACTSVDAKHSISVNVAHDSTAFLAFRKDCRDGRITPNAKDYVDVTNGQISFDFTSTDVPGNGQGVNINATTVIDDILQIEDQGTQSVYVGYSHPASPNGNFALYHEDNDFLDGSGGSNYDTSAGNYANDVQLNINTAPDADSDGNPDLVYLEPGDQLNHIGIFFFSTPDATTISADPVTFKAADEFEDL